MPSRTRSGSSPAWPSCDQADRAHDLAGRAEPALEAVMRDERRLHRMQLVALRHALDREDIRAVVADRQRQARIDPPPVDQHRAGAALSAVAALLGAGQIKPLAQQIEQRDPRIVQCDCLAPHRSRSAISTSSCGAPISAIVELDRSRSRVFTAAEWGRRWNGTASFSSDRALYTEDASVFKRHGKRDERYGRAFGQDHKPAAARRRGSQSRARAGGSEGGVQRRRSRMPAWRRWRDAPASASARCTGISRPARRCSRRSIGARSSSSPILPNN